MLIANQGVNLVLIKKMLSVFTCVVGTQKNCVIETVLLSTHFMVCLVIDLFYALNTFRSSTVFYQDCSSVQLIP